MDWIPLWTLPNVILADPVESEFFALVPPQDERVQTIAARAHEFKTFMDRFCGTFGQRFQPAIILRRADAKGALASLEAAASFRDAVAVACALRSRSLDIVYGAENARPRFSSTFAINPWMVSKNFKYIMADTPALWALHKAEAFIGHASPDIGRMEVRRAEFDLPLLNALLDRLPARYGEEQPDRKNVQLFRSLNMAYQALLIPGGGDAVKHDYGRSIALWIAAFEILVHNGWSSQRCVEQRLENVPWANHDIRGDAEGSQAHDAQDRVDMARSVCVTLYKARNDFLHGNDISESALVVPDSGQSLLSLAAPLYRLLLTEAIDITWKHAFPMSDDLSGQIKFASDKGAFLYNQSLAERALLLAKTPQKQDGGRMKETPTMPEGNQIENGEPA